MRLGPILSLSVIVNDLAAALAFYGERLRVPIAGQANLTKQRALDLGETGLIDAPATTLAIGAHARLELIESRNAQKSDGPGWIGMRLELPDLSEIDPREATRELVGPSGERVLLSRASGANPLVAVMLGCLDRACTHAFYAGLGLPDAAQGEGGRLHGGQAIEFIEVPAATASADTVRAGIRLVSFARTDERGRRQRGADDPSARILGGADGEGVELV